MAKQSIASRSDLSFTATSDEPGIRSNWNVPHDPKGYWGDTVPIGRRYFGEIAELAEHDEESAFIALLTAINGPEWNRSSDGGCGWGIEHGFTQELAAAAIVGLRVLRDGANPFQYE